MYEMQILVGGEEVRLPHSKELTIEGGEWTPVAFGHLPVASPPVPRYDRRDDAERMLDRLFPDLPACRKRVEEVR